MLGLGTKLNLVGGSVTAGVPRDEGYTGEKHLAFDGVNEYGEVSAADSFMNAVGTTGGTLSAWVRSDDIVPSSNNQVNYLFGGFVNAYPLFKYFSIGFQRYNNQDHIIHFRRNLHLTDSSQSKTWHDMRSSSAVSVSDDTWHHVALVVKPFQSSWSTSLYLDGSSVTSSSVTTPSAANTDSYYDSALNFLVSRYSTIYEQFDVNEIGVWNSELTSSEIAEIYNQGSDGFDLSKDKGDYASSSDLYSWYKMGDETSGSTEPDSSGNSRDMTLYNTPTVETT